MCHPETYMVHHLLPALLPEHTAGPLSKVEVQSTVDIELWSSDDVSQQPLWLCSISETRLDMGSDGGSQYSYGL